MIAIHYLAFDRTRAGMDGPTSVYGGIRERPNTDRAAIPTPHVYLAAIGDRPDNQQRLATSLTPIRCSCRFASARMPGLQQHIVSTIPLIPRPPPASRMLSYRPP